MKFYDKKLKNSMKLTFLSFFIAGQVQLYPLSPYPLRSLLPTFKSTPFGFVICNTLMNTIYVIAIPIN